MSDVAIRSAFLIRDGETIEAAWMLGGELPDIDAVHGRRQEISALELHAAREIAATEPPGNQAEHPIEATHLRNVPRAAQRETRRFG